jgi:Tol biopolymer transport system component
VGAARLAARACAFPEWSPDSKSFTCSRYVRWDQDEHEHIWSVMVFRLRSPGGARLAEGMADGWSRRGDEIYYTATGYGLRAARSDGSGDRAVGPRWLGAAQFAPSPDGARLAVVGARNRPYYDAGVFVIRAHCDRVRVIDKTPYTYDDDGPLIWSRDGRRLAWVVNGLLAEPSTTPGDQILVAPPDGSRHPTQVTHEPRDAIVTSVTFSSDGRTLLYTSQS